MTTEREIVAALVAATEEKITPEVKIEQVKKPRKSRRLGRRLGAIGYMGDSSIPTPFTIRF